MYARGRLRSLSFRVRGRVDGPENIRSEFDPSRYRVTVWVSRYIKDFQITTTKVSEAAEGGIQIIQDVVDCFIQRYLQGFR